MQMPKSFRLITATIKDQNAMTQKVTQSLCLQ